MAKGVKTSEARKLIGKAVEWDVSSLMYPVRRGIVEDVVNRNVRIDGDWYWLPTIKEFRVMKDE